MKTTPRLSLLSIIGVALGVSFAVAQPLLAYGPYERRLLAWSFFLISMGLVLGLLLRKWSARPWFYAAPLITVIVGLFALVSAITIVAK